MPGRREGREYNFSAISFCYTLFAICHLTSVICHLPSAIRHAPSTICQTPYPKRAPQILCAFASSRLCAQPCCAQPPARNLLSRFLLRAFDLARLLFLAHIHDHKPCDDDHQSNGLLATDVFISNQPAQENSHHRVYISVCAYQ